MKVTLIRNGTLVDGRGGPPLPRAGVVVVEDRLWTAGPEQTLSIPEGDLHTIDAGGQHILPGFIDAHVHLMFQEFDLARRMGTPFSLNFYRAIEHMRRTLEAGITSVRDAGGADLGVKAAVEQGLVEGPRMQLSIAVLTITGGHGDGWTPSGMSYDLFPSHPGRPDGRCDGVPEVRRKAREVLRAGAEVIKVCATGGVLSPTDDPQFTQFSQEELRAIVEEGHFRNGVRVMAHAQGAQGVKNAVRAGIHSIEHGIYLDEEAVEMMVAHGTFLVPTLLAPRAVLEIGEAGGSMPEWGLRKAAETIDIHRESIARAYRAGVRIAMGTDAGVGPHGSNLRELGLLCDIGMRPMEVIEAATRVSAECLGWEDLVGTLEAGKLADLVVTSSDPLADLVSLEKPENIALVMKGGQVVKDTLTESGGK